MQGTVKFYDLSKGYGFIRPDDASGDVFVHVSKLTEAGLRMLNSGDVVSFDVVPSSRKPGQFAAANVRMLVENI